MSAEAAGDYLGAPAHFLVIVPGYMGSKLRDKRTGKLVWMDVPGLLKDPLRIQASLERFFQAMLYPNDHLEPAGIMDKVVFVPPWAKQEHYGRLFEKLREVGYQIDPPGLPGGGLAAYTFAYDWRQDNRISARELGQTIERLSGRHGGAKAWIIGHSNGGIVARWYIEKEGGKECVERLFLMGSPWDGAPKSMRVMMSGLDVFFLRFFNRFNFAERMKDIIRSFPSFYQLIPHQNPFLRDTHNQAVDPFTDLGWLEGEHYRQMLLDGRRFNQELGNDLSVDTVCFFGRKKPTITAGVVSRGAGGRWTGITWTDNTAGDGTVPERSAVHPKARASYAFAVDHGNIYVDPQVLPQLEWELLGKYQLSFRAGISTERLTVELETDKDVYNPGEPIAIRATIHENVEQASPVSHATIKTRLAWREALPGSNGEQPPASVPDVELWEDIHKPGHYAGQLPAPPQEGYYQLEVTIWAADEPPLRLEELLAVESEPAPLPPPPRRRRQAARKYKPE